MMSPSSDKLLGAGGMAILVEAERPDAAGHPRPVAIKRIADDYKFNSIVLERFRREVELHLDVSPHHPNFVKAYGVEHDHEGTPCLVMEKLDGINLLQATADQRLPVEVVRAILHEVLEALAVAHARDVLHRDVSPGNIMLLRTGAIKLIDFGLATRASWKTIQPGFKGTLGTASPEAIYGLDWGPSADLYSLAAVAFLLLTGEPAFGSGEACQVMARMRVWDIRPLPPDCPADLHEILSGLLRTPKKRRYHSAGEVLAMLRQHGLPVADRACIAQIAAQAPAICKQLPAIAVPPSARQARQPAPERSRAIQRRSGTHARPAAARRYSLGLGLALVAAVAAAAFLWIERTQQPDRLPVVHRTAPVPCRGCLSDGPPRLTLDERHHATPTLHTVQVSPEPIAQRTTADEATPARTDADRGVRRRASSMTRVRDSAALPITPIDLRHSPRATGDTWELILPAATDR